VVALTDGSILVNTPPLHIIPNEFQPFPFLTACLPKVLIVTCHVYLDLSNGFPRGFPQKYCMDSSSPIFH